MKNSILKSLLVSAIFALGFVGYAQQGEVEVIQDPNIEKLLEYKKDLRTVNVYKIQIFQGSRAEAERVHSKFKSLYGQWPTSMEFNTPNYKIWVGNFRDRLEADRALARIKRSYMNAFIFQPKKG
ncbi:SPOR domain-containing protein [Winogradskyella maritima]|uniref:SPOR domain-containing protein n=1 Tax=Winogradskyella maritima TaxID=1517766 RepID=A0ABV8AEC7_9FLAO|nr:SPOR domain-containing protein [Winogradskyella maritima]